jgi:hypothetical protein
MAAPPALRLPCAGNAARMQARIVRATLRRSAVHLSAAMLRDGPALIMLRPRLAQLSTASAMRTDIWHLVQNFTQPIILHLARHLRRAHSANMRANALLTPWRAAPGLAAAMRKVADTQALSHIRHSIGKLAPSRAPALAVPAGAQAQIVVAGQTRIDRQSPPRIGKLICHCIAPGAMDYSTHVQLAAARLQASARTRAIGTVAQLQQRSKRIGPVMQQATQQAQQRAQQKPGTATIGAAPQAQAHLRTIPTMTGAQAHYAPGLCQMVVGAAARLQLGSESGLAQARRHSSPVPPPGAAAHGAPDRPQMTAYLTRPAAPMTYRRRNAPGMSEPELQSHTREIERRVHTKVVHQIALEHKQETTTKALLASLLSPPVLQVLAERVFIANQKRSVIEQYRRGR